MDHTGYVPPLHDGAIVFFDLPNIVAIGPSTGAAPPSGVDPNAIFKTGDMIWLDQEGTRSGWVRDNGLTIGSATSGATEPGGNVAAAQPLFEFCWNTYSNTICPVIPGRGSNSLADWTANKKLTLPDKRGYMPIGADAMGNVSSGRFTNVFAPTSITVPGSSVGENTHVQTVAEMATHTPTGAVSAPSITVNDNKFVALAVQAGSKRSRSGQWGQHHRHYGQLIQHSNIHRQSNRRRLAASNVPLAIIGTFYRKL